MRASLGLPPSDGAALLALALLWALSVVTIGIWCWRMAGRMNALVRVSTLEPLTGLLSGRVFTEERWPAALRSTEPLGLLFVDLDHLKQHNDLHGYAAGNRYIAHAADVLRRACRRGVDEVFRLHTAGDEFLVLVRGETARGLASMAEHVVARFRREGLSASIGAAWTASPDHRQRAELLQRAEEAKGAAKAAGKGCAVVAPSGTPGKASGGTAETRSVTTLLGQLVTETGAPFQKRIVLDAAEGLPAVQEPDEPFLLAATLLVLHGLHTARGPVRLRARLEKPDETKEHIPPAAATRLRLQLCAEMEPHADSLLAVSLRTCEQQGGAWHIEPQSITLLWPLPTLSGVQGGGTP